MAIITARIPEELNNILDIVSAETDRNKGYIIKKALENYLEEKADIWIALARIEKDGSTIPLDDIEKKYGLVD